MAVGLAAVTAGGGQNRRRRRRGGPAAARADLPAVLFDQPLDQRQPHAEAATAARNACLALRKRIEDARDEIGLDANAVVADADDGALVASVGSDGDCDAP